MIHFKREAFILWTVRLLRFGFGILFIYASIDKVIHPADFAVMVENYRVVGEDLSNWVAIFIPFLEIITGILLILGIWTDAVSVITLGLMTIFLILVSQAYFRGLDISCGCFDAEEGHVIGLLKLLTNLFYTIMSLVLVYLVFKSTKETRDAHHESSDQKSA
jgi:uncharacterized membrane protein YphA (DoxX/SURF4 family)